MHTALQHESIVRAKTRFIHSEVEPATLDEILPRVVLESWRRSLSAGIAPTGPALPRHFGRGDRHTEVAAAAAAELDSVVAYGRGESFRMLFADHQGLILLKTDADRASSKDFDVIGMSPGRLHREDNIGTSAIGIALRLGRPAHLHGPQNYHSSLSNFSTYAAPVFHPRTGEVEGLVGLVCRADRATNLLYNITVQAARNIQTEMSATRDEEANMLVAAYRGNSDSDHVACAAIGLSIEITNIAMRQLLSATEIEELRRYLSTGNLPRTRTVHLDTAAGQRVTLRVRPVETRSERIGILVSLTSRTDVSRPSSAATSVDEKGGGCGRIREAERSAILSVLTECAGNRAQAAASLGIARSSLYRKIEKYGLENV